MISLTLLLNITYWIFVSNFFRSLLSLPMKHLKLEVQTFFNPREKNPDQYFPEDQLNLPKEMTVSEKHLSFSDCRMNLFALSNFRMSNHHQSICQVDHEMSQELFYFQFLDESYNYNFLPNIFSSNYYSSQRSARNHVGHTKNHKCDKKKITSQAICFSWISIMIFRYQPCECLSNFRRVRRFRVHCLFRIRSVIFPNKSPLKLFYESYKIQFRKRQAKKFDITFVVTNLCNNYLEKKF